jgi:hypothetical protein
VSHEKVINALQLAVKNTGMEVTKRNYTLSASGMNLFGSWVLNQEDNGMRWMVGFRNSMRKDFAVGICAGNHVIACSNMMFKGDDFIEFRRHTGRLTLDELLEIAKRSFIGLIDRMKSLADWHKNLKNRAINQDDFKILTFDSMKKDVFPPQQFPKFIECYEMEKKIGEGNESLYQFNGAITRLVRNQSLFNINDRTTRLTRVLNEFIDTHLF